MAPDAGIMAYLPVIDDAIPAALQALPWVLWRAEPRQNDKPAKVPYRIADPERRASSTDPATWGTFGDALDAHSALVGRPDVERGPIVGVGVVLTEEAGITCLDLDHVLDPSGALDPCAQTVVDRAASWTEVSPSGTGLHVFVRGTLPEAVKGEHLEIYSRGRYMAVTGHHWPNTPASVREAQGYLNALWARAHEDDRPRRHYTGPTPAPPDDLAGALLAKLEGWGLPGARVKRWEDGYLVELARCPWADEHTTGVGGAAVLIRASGAYDFTCLHAHCAPRTWRDFRAAMDSVGR